MDLELSLRLNAAFSFATGFLLALAPASVGSWLDVSINGWLRLVGIALIAHGAVLLWTTRQDSIASWARLNIAAIGPYPLLMVALIVTGLVSGVLGRSLLLVDGAIVGLLAIAQWSGLRQSTPNAQPAST